MNSNAADKLVIDTYREADEADLIALWQRCGLIVPWNNPLADIARKTADSAELFFIGRIAGRLVASCMAGYDGHRGWIYYLAVLPEWQRHGLAARLVGHAENRLAELGCPKVDLMVRERNEEVIAFYRSIGYGLDPVSVLSKRLLDDDEHDFV
jgi:ribosomal protein S18 acetylase RimI-like enzyme